MYALLNENVKMNPTCSTSVQTKAGLGLLQMSTIVKFVLLDIVYLDLNAMYHFITCISDLLFLIFADNKLHGRACCWTWIFWSRVPGEDL